MKYFDKLPSPVLRALAVRGANTDGLAYCVKADLNGENCYVDVYIAFDSKTLHIISGYDIFTNENKDRAKDKKKDLTYSDFEVSDYSYYDLADIESAYLDRHQAAARLMLKKSDNAEFPIARLSLGYCEKFEQFCQRLIKTKNNEEIDDSALEENQVNCPICDNRYPDPNRRICPKCLDRTSIFKRLLGMFKNFKAEMIFIFFGIILRTVSLVTAPYFGSKLLYDEVLNENGQYYGRILMIVLIMLVVSFVAQGIEAVYGVIISQITPKVTHKLRTDIFSSMQKLSLNFFTSKQTGSLMTRVDRDSMNIYWFFTDIIPFGLLNLLKLLGLVIIMTFTSPILSLIIIALVATIALCDRRFGKSQRKFWRKQNHANRSVNAVLSDALNGQRVVKAFAKEDQEIDRFNDRNDYQFSVEQTINKRHSTYGPRIGLLVNVCSTLMYMLGAWMVINDQLMFGSLTLLMSYFGMAWEPIYFFTWIGDRWARCVDAASRMFEILDSSPTVKPPVNPVPVGDLKGDIELKNVSFEYEAGRQIIKKVSLTVEGGKMLGIVGKTGAGKSTIINLISRLYDVTDGEITIDGINIKNIAFEDLRHNIGVVSQETYLFMGTIADNIRYARPEASMDEVIEAAKSANAHDFIMKLPDGYDTVIGSGAVSLSGGEKQRISIARAIIQKPNILILDEATASMDTKTERKIQAAINAIKEGRTIISIAHRLSTLRDADMLCVIENGELCETGTHDELIRNKGKYFELYKLQADALKFIGIGEENAS